MCSLAAYVRTCRSRYSDWRDYESERGGAVKIGRRTSSFPPPTTSTPRYYRRDPTDEVCVRFLYAAAPLPLLYRSTRGSLSPSLITNLFKVVNTAAAQMITYSYTLDSSRGRTVDVPSAAPATTADTAPSRRRASTCGAGYGWGTRWPR